MTADERVHCGLQLGDSETLNRFAAECGMMGPVHLLVLDEGASSTRELDFPSPFIRVGRAASSQLVLSDSAVSRRHAYLQVLDGRLFCFDLDSREGLCWSSGRRRQGVVDESGVRIDPFSLLSPQPESAGNKQSDVASIHAPADDFHLQFTNAAGRNSGNVRRQTRQHITFLGRSKRCHVKLSHESVSRFHCSLVRTAESFWVVDLSGEKGIFVNGERVSFARISIDDEVMIGRFRMRLCPESADSHLVLAGAEVVGGGRPDAPAQAGRHHPVIDPPVPAAPPSVSENALIAMMDQFEQFQQSVLDQNYQQTLLLAELLRAADTGAIHQQIRELERITLELQMLYAESHKGDAGDRRQVSAPASDSQVASEKFPRAITGDSVVEPVSSAEQLSAAESDLDDAQDSSAGGSRAELASTAEETTPFSSHASDDEPLTDFDVSDEPDVNGGDTNDAPIPEVSPLDSFVSEPREEIPELEEPNAHLWLTQRITELERERQSGFQRLIRMLSPGAQNAPRASVKIDEE